MAQTRKFRGLNVTTNKWVYGDLLHMGGKTFICYDDNDHDSMSGAGNIRCEVKEETIGQYVGLKDKNGKEIYEGDIVRWDDGSNGAYWRKCEVKWVKSGFQLHGVTYDAATPKDTTKVSFKFGQFIYEYDGVLEIIGNIHTN